MMAQETGPAAEWIAGSAGQANEVVVVGLATGRAGAVPDELVAP
jgi:hypothetical protein